MSNFFYNKNILIAGGAGFVGSNLIERLVKLKSNITATYFNNKPQDFSICNYIQTDLADYQKCEEICNGMDLVFMCAANSSGAAVIQNSPLAHFDPNLIMNMNMLRASHSMKVKKYIFISSNTVYPVTDYPVKEDDVNNEFFEKYHIVGWMKRFAEISCEIYSNRIAEKLSTLIIRPGNLYGPHDKFDPSKSKVIPSLIRKIVKNEFPLEVWGDGNDIKDFIYIDDFIDGLLSAVEKSKFHDLFNICNGKSVTIKDVINNLLEIENKMDMKIKYDASKPTMIPIRLISGEKAKNEIGFTSKISLYDGLNKTINWYRRQYNQ
ncbi:NAD(P)-dependent oxidoreductase [Pelagibacteraceae bacterium]|nr:NAD(P)-dependent oxidoreductase [Pelagibacteraceae bacterium]